MKPQIETLLWEAGAKFHSQPPMRKVTGVCMTFEELDRYTDSVIQYCADLLVDKLKKKGLIK